METIDVQNDPTGQAIALTVVWIGKATGRSIDLTGKATAPPDARIAITAESVCREYGGYPTGTRRFLASFDQCWLTRLGVHCNS